ncbi:hypothetical protein N7490_011145 [Penicillium lividum]|nr:hypothetical protein N7490_011145 [Penicillium lividum]
MAEDAHPTYLSPSELGSRDYWENYYARTLAHISNPKSETEIETENSIADDSDADVNEEDDPGTSWFSEHNAPEKVLRFLTRRSFPLSPKNTRTQSQPTILDLGTGNGSMLALLQKRGGFSGKMVGVDYSPLSVELARELQRSRGHSAYRTDDEESDDEDSEDGQEQEQGGVEIPPIQFEEWDVLASKAALSPTGLPITSTDSDSEILPWFPYSAGGFDIVLDKGTFDAISLADDAKETRTVVETGRVPDGD